MSNRKENLIVGLDIGTTKICAIIASMTESGLDIVGIGTSVSVVCAKASSSTLKARLRPSKKPYRKLS